jgi:antitoxin component YwqK of YwqJK toxin-antitoxin module
MENFSGEFVQEIDNGKIVINFENGKKEGISKLINKDGTVVSEIGYKNDEMNGEMRQYYPTGRLLSVWYYENDSQTGPFFSYYESGIKQLETNYKDGQINGKFVVFDEFGDRINECIYKDGKKHGKSLSYYSKTQGGGVYELSYYVDGVIDGDKVTFYPTGEVMSVTPYIKGKAQEYPKNYSPSGNLGLPN